jgi:hypothetical protein
MRAKNLIISYCLNDLRVHDARTVALEDLLPPYIGAVGRTWTGSGWKVLQAFVHLTTDGGLRPRHVADTLMEVEEFNRAILGAGAHRARLLDQRKCRQARGQGAITL